MGVVSIFGQPLTLTLSPQAGRGKPDFDSLSPFYGERVRVRGGRTTTETLR